VAEASSSPLAGKRVVITRAAEQSAALIQRLGSLGAIPILLPLISFADPADCGPLDAALSRLHEFDSIIFTSENAVRFVGLRLEKLRGTSLSSQSALPPVAAVGPATAAAAEQNGFSVDLVGKTHSGVALAAELGDRVKGSRILLPRSDHANPDLPEALRRRGAEVTEVVAYRTVLPMDVAKERIAEILRGGADAILFFSPSAARNFAELAGADPMRKAQNRLVMAAIGPITATALSELAIDQHLIASDTAPSAAIEALENHFAKLETHSTPEVKRA
jgi:uroporphyrinogen III methyltransferase / synthase